MPTLYYLPVIQLLSEGILPYFKQGVQEYHCQNELSPDNTYLNWAKQQTSLDRCYARWDDDMLKDAVLRRIRLVDSMKENGFLPEYPIELLKYTYSQKGRRTLVDQHGLAVTFDNYDGHHRVLAAHLAGITHVPCIESSWPARNVQYVEQKSDEKKKSWYQPINFGCSTSISFQHPDNILHGAKKYDYILRRNLEPVKDRCFLDIGCNTGVISACIAQDWAAQVIGIDRLEVIEQAWWVYDVLWLSYGNLSFRAVDCLDLNAFQRLLKQIGYVDCILMSQFVYYLGDAVDAFIDICSNYTRSIVLQGNGLKQCNSVKSIRTEQPCYRGEYSQISGMQKLLQEHGYNTIVDAPDSYSKPVVRGAKKTNISKQDVDKILDELSINNVYFKTAKKRLNLSIDDLKQYIGLNLLDVGGTGQIQEVFKIAFPQTRYEYLDASFDVRTASFPYDDNFFDTIVCWETIEHLWTVRNDGIINWEGIRNAWKEMYRILKPCGVLHLTTTNRFCPRALDFFRPMTVPQIHGSVLTEEISWGHAREISAEELRRLTKITGCFQVCKISSIQFYEPYMPDTTVYKNALNKFELLIGRKAHQDELWDSLLFVGIKGHNFPKE
jgi:SAM-dependent methyltransferase